MKSRTVCLAALTAVLVLTALLALGCRKQTASASRVALDGKADAASDLAARQGIAAETAVQTGASARPATPGLPRMVVRNAEVSLIVTNAAKAVDSIVSLAARYRGYVSASREWREADATRASMTLRVPGEQLDALLRELRGVAKRVDNESVSSDDVSQEFVDLGARLRNLEATENELRGLLKTIRERSRKASEVLEIHAEVTRIRGEIEQVRGRMSWLQQVTAYSTVTIQLIPDAVTVPIVSPRWTPLVPVLDASRALISTLQLIATMALWTLIYFVPLGTLAALMLLGVVRLQRLAKWKGVDQTE